jgi:aspartate-semialdehyde dehydrogenase
MEKKFSIAVVGATGNVGREIISILEERDFPIENLFLLASSRSQGQQVNFNDEELIVEDLAEFDFSKVQISLFSPGGSVSAEYAPKATAAGCIVIDNTSFFRMKNDVPLVVPEVNANILDDFFKKNDRSNIIANPNCSTIQMVVALKPLHDEAIINRVVVSTYQSVSGAGKEAMDELFNQTQNIYANKPIEKNKFTKQIAFNVIPQIDSFLENGNTKEEQKMIDETKKILDKDIKISATCVRVPVFISHSESINIEFDSPLSEKKATELLKNFDNISVVDHRKEEGYVSPVEAAGEDKVYVSRIREDHSVDNGLNIWVVSDNLRKGAALNAVQIAELLITKYNKYL